MAYEKIFLRQESSRCLLCENAPCSSACPDSKKVSDIIRSIRFNNVDSAAQSLKEKKSCEGCDAPCMKVCNCGKIDRPVNIPKILETAGKIGNPVENTDADLSVNFCGVKCKNPFLLSSSVVASNYEMVAKAFKMGWAGVAFKTIGFLTPNEASPRFSALEKESNPFVGFKNIEQISDHTVEENLEFIRRLKKDFPDHVIVASIMGRDEEEWTKLAVLMEENGADIIECNFSCPQMVGKNVGSDVGTNPELVEKFTAATRKGTKLPVLAKMTPNITDMTVPAIASIKAGADGIAAINTIKSLMNFELEGKSFVSSPNVSGKSCNGGYSGKAVKPVALRFISDMKNNPQLKNVPISGMGGIETWDDALEFMILGCGTVQVTTSVMQYGYRIIDDLINGTKNYLSKIGEKKLENLVGKALSDGKIVSPDEIDRNTIEYPKFDRNLCVSCGRCYVSCFDGGHQALVLDEENKPKMDPKKCVGCQLCRLVCPSGAISGGTRVLKK